MQCIVRLLGTTLVLLTYAAAGTAWAASPALPYGINTHLPSSALLDRVAAAGIAWIRVDFNWYDLQPARDRYDWTLADAVVHDARARGLNVYATLSYTPAWANGGQGRNAPPLNADDWYNFVYETVSRYRAQVQHWGMWNEPNFEGFWSGSVEQYLQIILEVGARAVRDAQGGFVCGPELGMQGDWQVWFYQILSQKPRDLDIVTIHSYAETGTHVLLELLTPRAIMVLTGTDAKELWLTETGWDTSEVSEEAQAAYYEQVLEGLEQEGGPDKAFFYQLVDEPGSPEQWGILRVDLSPKPAYEAYQRHIATHVPMTALREQTIDDSRRQE
jgi:polysaccharide biosynthesis protein PslG